MESSVNESNPPQAAAGLSLESIPRELTPAATTVGGRSQATAVAAATPPTAPQHSTALQRAVS